jgi:hypothetical protein
VHSSKRIEDTVDAVSDDKKSKEQSDPRDAEEGTPHALHAAMPAHDADLPYLEGYTRDIEDHWDQGSGAAKGTDQGRVHELVAQIDFPTQVEVEG